jgi:hypothetical protein
MIRSTRHTATESRWLKLLGTLNEYRARLFVADKALDQGRGGISRLSELTGMSRTTITKSVSELNSRKELAVAERGQIREACGGRKKVEDTNSFFFASTDSTASPVFRKQATCRVV